MRRTLLASVVLVSLGSFAACKTAGVQHPGSQLASVSLSLPSTLKVGEDYDHVQVKTRLKKADGSFDAWATTKDWTQLTAGKKEALLEDPIKILVGTYQFNVIYLKGETSVASGSESNEGCLIKESVLKLGSNKVAVKVCLGEKAPVEPEVVSGDADVAIETTVVNSSGTTEAASAAKNDGGTAKQAATPPPAYPACPSTLTSASSDPLWSWSSDQAFCESAVGSKEQFAKSKGCSCRVIAADK